MTEIWLGYGATEVMMDVRGENQDQIIASDNARLEDEKLAELITSGIDLGRPTGLVLLQDTAGVRKVVSTIFSICGQKSFKPPALLADPRVISSMRGGLPEGAAISEFGDIGGRNLAFASEVELDGLFGFQTVSTRLLRRFGRENMLSAYAKRRSNMPESGRPTGCMAEANRFADNFEITALEIVTSSNGICDVATGHPAKTKSAGLLEGAAVRDLPPQRSLVISTGKPASNSTLSDSLESLWSSYRPIRQNGTAVLLAECGSGLGSDAMRMFVRGMVGPDMVRNPVEYVDGLEDLLYLEGVRKSMQVCLVSALPELYVKRLGMVPMRGAASALEYLLKAQGARHRLSIVKDGSRVLLR